jgi:hypothetical protein
MNIYPDGVIDIKRKLYQELELKAEFNQEGFALGHDVLRHIDVGGTRQEQVQCMFNYNRNTDPRLSLPAFLILPHGLTVFFRHNGKSRHRLEFDGGKLYAVHGDGAAYEVTLPERPRYYDKLTSDGTPMRTVAVHNTNGVIFVAYSNECALQSTSKDCLFCNINATKASYGEIQGVTWKYPHQIGETVAEAYKEGNRHLTISGGFVPERREVDYYLDVAESIREHTGLDDFNGTACIGAPRDLTIIEKYKEAGYRTLAINIEVWNAHFFRAYCPGKEKECGGRDHWVAALEHGVRVFGPGRVRSNMVGGLENKDSTLEGIETLTSKGVLAISPAWIPNPGSALEGHRSPEPEWHLDVARKTYEIYRKRGFTWEQVYDGNAEPLKLLDDIYRIEEQRFPVFETVRETELAAA